MGYELAMKILVLSLVLVAVAGSIPPSKMLRRVPAAIYVFGDSTMDVGNSNYLPGKNVPRADHPYYGIDMPAPANPMEGSAMATTPPTSSHRAWAS